MSAFFVTHPEVVVDPAVPIEEWGLSARGRSRASTIVGALGLEPGVRVVSSAERKATEAAAIVAADLGGVDAPAEVREFGELDRSSTGYLPPREFETVVDEFFARPLAHVRGWESAADAQTRIVRAVKRLTRDDRRTTVVVAHGGVGALLLCDLLGVPISRVHDQPGMGSWFAFDPAAWEPVHGWRRLPAGRAPGS